MKRSTLSIPLLFALAATGCATLAPAEGLVDGPSIRLEKQTPFVSTWRHPDFDGAAHPRIAAVSFDPVLDTTLSADERAELALAVETALHHAFPQTTGAPVEPTHHIKATILDVDASNPTLNKALALLVGPVDTGGARVRFSLHEGGNPEPISVVEVARNGRVISRKGFQRWGHATQAFTFAAEALADYVEDPKRFEADHGRS